MAVVALAAVVVMETVAVGVIDRQPYRWVSWGSPVWPLDPSGGDDESGHRLRSLSPADHANRRNLNQSPKPNQNRRTEFSAIPSSTREQVSVREPSTKSQSYHYPGLG